MLLSYAPSIPLPTWISNIFKHPDQLWRFLGFTSSIVGLLCYAFSSSFQHLYGEWNLLKIILYAAVSLIIFCIMLFPKKLQVLRNFKLFPKNLQIGENFQLEALVVLLALLVTSLYSFFNDRKVTGEPDALSLISNGSFTFMAVSLSKQIGLPYEMGVSAFFLGCFTIQLMKINFYLIVVAAVFDYFILALRSQVPLEIRPVNAEELVSILTERDDNVPEAEEYSSTGTSEDMKQEDRHQPSSNVSAEPTAKKREKPRTSRDPKRAELKKVVLKVGVFYKNGRRKAIKAVKGLSGVKSISIDKKHKRLTLIGDIDPEDVKNQLRKVCHIDILSAGPAKEEDEELNEAGEKINDITDLVKAYEAYFSGMRAHNDAFAGTVEENEQDIAGCRIQ